MTDWVKKHPWWIDAARLYVGLITRAEATSRGVPRMTLPKYALELAELKEFSLWLHWQNEGKHGARPKFDLPVPRWAWTVLGEYNKKHKHPKPPGPSPTVETFSKWKNPPWQGVGLHVTWGFESGDWTPQQLADIISRHSKVKWAFLEMNPANYNEAYANAFRDALHRYGRKFGIWERADAQKSYPESRIDHVKRIVNTYDPDFYGADIEEFPVDDPALPGQIKAAFPNLPRLMLVPGEPDAPFLKPWFDADFDMMTQSYAANIGQPPVPGIAGATDHDTFWRGGPRNFIVPTKSWGNEWWQHGSGPHSVPIIEVWAEGNPSLAAQMGSDAVVWFEGNWSIWNAEQMRQEDWDLLV